MDEGIGYVIGLIVLGILYLLGYIAFGNWSCSNTAEMMQTDYHFKVVGGCYIKQDNRYIPINSVKNIIIAKDK